MRNGLMVFHLLLSLTLIASVLLHPAKSDGMAGIGGPAKLFGSQKGAETGLNRLTIGLAIAWALLAAILTTPHLTL